MGLAKLTEHVQKRIFKKTSIERQYNMKIIIKL